MRRSLGPGAGVEREIEDAVEDDVLAVAIRGASQSAAGKLDVDVERARRALDAVAVERRGHVRLVGGLVLREARVAVDAEDGALGVTGERDAAVGEAPAEVGDEHPHRVAEFVVVGLLPGLEPLAVVVALEALEEAEAVLGEAGERGEVGGRGGDHEAGGAGNSSRFSAFYARHASSVRASLIPPRAPRRRTQPSPGGAAGTAARRGWTAGRSSPSPAGRCRRRGRPRAACRTPAPGGSPRRPC